MTAGAVLAIDQGTSGTTAVVVDPFDGVLADANFDRPPRYPGGAGHPVTAVDLVPSPGYSSAERRN